MDRSRDGLPLFHVDAFTREPFRGNPAAVCLLDGPMPDDWLQSMAFELNLPETAFVTGKGSRYHLRWFTPTVEMDLCGHATLATAHVLWETGVAGENKVLAFATRSGVLEATRVDSTIELNFPSEPAAQVPDPPGLLAALGVAEARWVGRNRMDVLVELESEEAVRRLRPNLRALPAVSSRGVIVTSHATTEGVDFVSRFFAPAAGIDEDPVTGSAHCCLAPYWSERLQKAELVGYQASARGGYVRVRVEGNRVVLGGEAVTIFSGELLASAFPPGVRPS